MIHIYIFDKDFIERLQYSHSTSADNLEEELSAMSNAKFVTKDIINEKPPFDRGWVISDTLLNYSGNHDMVTDKVNY